MNTKRTEQHLADPHAGADEYILEKIAGSALKAGVRQWLVHWKAFLASARTWEPIENLTGCEDYVAQYNAELEDTDINPG